MTIWQPEALVPLMLKAGLHAVNHPFRRYPEKKADGSWVTPADKENEEFFRTALKDSGPGFIGEETLETAKVSNPLKGTYYVLDPIDGTAPYTNGLPTWGISLGLIEDGFFLEGMLFLPEEGVLVWSEKGKNFLSKFGFPYPSEIPAFDLAREWTIPENPSENGMISVSQIIAKKGKYSGPRYIQATASSVWALTQMILGRSLGYISRGSLWDFAGAMPILNNSGFQAALFRDGNRKINQIQPLFHGYPALNARGHIILAPTLQLVEEIETSSDFS